MPSLLKEQLGMVGSYGSTEETVNAIVKLLNESKAPSTETVDPLDGVEFNDSYNITIATGTQGIQTFTYTHNFGKLPTGFIVKDMTWNVDFTESPVLVRTSWTTTQIIFKIAIGNFSGSSRTASGTFKVLVLR